MKLITAMAMLLVVAMAGIGWAATPTGGSIRDGDVLGQIFEDRYDFIEGWNVDQPFDGSWDYAALCQGPTYVAGATYWLERVEFMAGAISGPAVIEIRGDDGSGCPSGPVLASGGFDQVEELGWQGADLDSPVAIMAGETYHINYIVVVGSLSSFATQGDLYTHCWSFDCETWDGPDTFFHWMAKFYGTDGPIDAETATWDEIKSLYR